MFSYRHLAFAEPFGLAAGATYPLQANADDRGFTFVHDGLERVEPDGLRLADGGSVPADRVGTGSVPPRCR